MPATYAREALKTTMELRGLSALLYTAGSLGMATFFGLRLLDDPLGVLQVTGVWEVISYIAAVVMVVGTGLGLLMGYRVHRSTRHEQTPTDVQ